MVFDREYVVMSGLKSDFVVVVLVVVHLDKVKKETILGVEL